MNQRSFRENQSGQVIVITGLLVSVLLLSTAIFVIDLQKNTPKADACDCSFFDGYRQTAWNTLVSALANASGGGSTDVLTQDLTELKAIIAAHSYQAMVALDYTASNMAPYTEGLWINQGSSGVGVSSAAVNFTFSSFGPTQSSSIQYDLNVSSEIHTSGSYIEQNETKTVSLTVNVFNEGAPALAQSFSFSYQNDTEWVQADASVVDHGDGTYTVAFNADTGLQYEPLPVMVQCVDTRGIIVEASLTCNHT
ncbi:MAG: hypothetical protein ACQCN6_05170 [Candidatus Bathyarchaeia archaeon]|jgi:hypothetical protein